MSCEVKNLIYVIQCGENENDKQYEDNRLIFPYENIRVEISHQVATNIKPFL